MPDQYASSPSIGQPPAAPDVYLAEIDVEKIRAAGQPADGDQAMRMPEPATPYRRPIPGDALSDEQLANELESDVRQEDQ